ncbi:Aldehyde/histidinol dehydrogenase [Cytidiella melzeri]|nr:Aldehyde/histidinol dehydrogenase [Cytidiella melzeri]
MSAANSQYTSLDEIDVIFTRISETWKSGVTRSLEYRRRQLLQLARMVQENHVAFEDALCADLGKQRLECASTELGPTVHGALHAAEHLEDWARPEKPKVDAWRSNWDATVYPVPKGIALIISPWNFPVVLALLPMVGAIAAGCPVVLKPSELTPTVSGLLARMFEQYMDPAAYIVVQGEIPETTKLLHLRWNHILYTGSGRVGRLVAAAAAKHVTPVTLELGGKSPVIIAPDADIDLAAKRVLFGKIQNSGQLCVTPDYVLVPRAIAEDFKRAMKKAYASFFPTDPLAADSPWSRIVNDMQYKRLMNLILTTKGTVLTGGVGDFRRRIATTVVGDVKLDDPLMEEEIFGPILPIVEVEDVDEAISIVADRHSPLVVYVFSNDEEVKQKCLERTSSGSLIFNDTVWQIVVHEMPFGGIGESGYGSYFSKNTFDVFTHRRSYCNMPAELEPFIGHRYPPYTDEGYSAMSANVHLTIPEN